ncbi:MAG: PepSY domain-containing protein, partial [Terriglobales bacterium]
MWAVTGIYLAFPLPFQKIINHYSPLIQYALPEDVTLAAPENPGVSVLAQTFGRGGRRPPIRRSAGDNFIHWIYYLHFGNFAGSKTKAVWVVLGLLPVILFVTGAIMWWNRVLSPAARRLRRTEGSPAVAAI